MYLLSLKLCIIQQVTKISRNYVTHFTPAFKEYSVSQMCTLLFLIRQSGFDVARSSSSLKLR